MKELRLKDFLGATTCQRCSVEFHLLQVFKRNKRRDLAQGYPAGGFHTDCGNCGARNFRTKKDLVTTKHQAPKPDSSTEDYAGLVDVVASVQRFKQARIALEQQEIVQQALLQETNKHKKCKCSKSKCLTMYCGCFADQRYCESCKCLDCNNTEVNEASRQAAMAKAQEKARKKPKPLKQPEDALFAALPMVGASSPPPVLLPQQSSSAEPVDRSIQLNRGDDKLYSSWLKEFNL
jgi:hypothetical protein